MKYLGHSAIIGSNVIFLTTILLLRKAGVRAEDGLVAMVIAAAVASMSLAFEPLFGVKRSTLLLDESQPTKSNGKDYLALFVWGLCYVAIYGSMIVYAKTITIPHVILAESLAPFIALLFFKHVHSEWRGRRDGLRTVIGVGLILFMAFSVWDRAKGSFFAEWNIFLFMAALYTVSQSMARYLSKRRPAYWAPSRLSLFSLMLIGGYLMATHPQAFLRALDAPVILLFGVASGILGLLNRGLFLYGLGNTSGIVAALLINTTLPLSMFFHILETDKVSNAGIIAAVVYCLFATYTTLARSSPKNVMQLSSQH